jgi:large subunit ribosomal protein L4e
MMSNADLARLINSDEIQSIIKAPTAVSAVIPKKRNPLTNAAVKTALNPYHADVAAREAKRNAMSKDARGKEIQKKRKESATRSKKFAGQRKAFVAAATAEGAVSF